MRIDQLSSQATRAATACAIALGFSIPVSVALDNVLLGAILLLWLAAVLLLRLSGGDIRKKFAFFTAHRVAQAALGLFALLLAGISWSDQPAEGLRILGKYADLAFVPVFVTLFQAGRDRARAGGFLIAALLLTLIISYLIAAGLDARGLPIQNESTQPYQVFKKYLTQSVLMAFGAYYFALLARDAATPRMRGLWALLSAAAIINVAFMLSGRSGQVALAALAMLFVYSIWRMKGVAMVAVILTFAGAGILSGYAPDNNRFAVAVKEFHAWQPDQGVRTSTGQRLDYAINSVAIVREHPLAGVGTGGFATAYARQVEGSQLEATVNPHNEYLNLTVQLGLGGLFAVCLLFALVWRHARALPTALERDLARGVALTFALGCLFNSMLMDHVEGLLFAWSIGVLFGGYDPARLRKEAVLP